jgi:hypothetical protein
LGTLPSAAGSERVTGNRQRVDVGLVLSWIERSIEPEPPRETEAPGQPEPVSV